MPILSLVLSLEGTAVRSTSGNRGKRFEVPPLQNPGRDAKVGGLIMCFHFKSTGG
jgi:hypothetical protein